MSEDDYKAGIKGIPFHPGMDRTDYDAGLSVYKQQQGILGPPLGGPKVEVSGPGFTGILIAHLLAIMYPIAGTLVVTGAGGAFLLVRALLPSMMGFAWSAAIVAAIVMLHYGVKAEHAMSRSRPYRVARHVFRLVVIGGPMLWYVAGFDGSQPPSLDQAFSRAPGGVIFAAILAIVAMHFLFRALDRKLFPVRDRYEIAQEKKYAKLTDDEIFAIKNAKFRAICAFSLVWLVATIALMFLLREAPVALLGQAPSSSYGCCASVGSSGCIGSGSRPRTSSEHGVGPGGRPTARARESKGIPAPDHAVLRVRVPRGQHGQCATSLWRRRTIGG